MLPIIEQYIHKKSCGISEYASQLNDQINRSGAYQGCIKNYNEPVTQGTIAIFHFSNATREVLLPLLRRKGQKNLVIVHDVLPRTWLVRWWNVLFFRLINSYASHIILHTTVAKNLLTTVYGCITSTKVTVIPHGIFITHVPPSEKEHLRHQYGFAPRDKILFSLGVISKQRGQLAFLKAFGKFGETNLKLIVSGKCKIKQAKTIMEKNKAISYYGFASNTQVEELYKICDAVLVYRKYSVGESSSTIAHGLGYGKPPLVSNIAPFKEMLADCGLLFENNEDAITTMLHGVANATINLDTLQQKVYQLREHYTWDTYFQKMRTLLET